MHCSVKFKKYWREFYLQARVNNKTASGWIHTGHILGVLYFFEGLLLPIIPTDGKYKNNLWTHKFQCKKKNTHTQLWTSRFVYEVLLSVFIFCFRSQFILGSQLAFSPVSMIQMLAYECMRLCCSVAVNSWYVQVINKVDEPLVASRWVASTGSFFQRSLKDLYWWKT